MNRTLSRILVAGSFVLCLLIDTNTVSAELRWNPFGGLGVEMPPPLVAEPGVPGANPRGLRGLPRLPIPQVQVPHVQVPEMSMPRFSMPSVSVPQMRMPRLSIPQLSMPEVALPQLPGLPGGKPQVMERFQQGQGRFWQSARAPFDGVKERAKFLPQVKPATMKMKTPQLKTPGIPKIPSLRATAREASDSPTKPTSARSDQPQTVTGWLSQPRPE